VLEGLKCARSLGFHKAELSIDASSVVHVLKNRQSHSLIGQIVLKQIWKLLDLDWEVDISHSFREANKCADALASVGCSVSNNSIFYDVCPHFISNFVLEDRLGVTSPRLISL
jgi:ribonuclease HI